MDSFLTQEYALLRMRRTTNTFDGKVGEYRPVQVFYGSPMRVRSVGFTADRHIAEQDSASPLLSFMAKGITLAYGDKIQSLATGACYRVMHASEEHSVPAAASPHMVGAVHCLVRRIEEVLP